MDPWIVLLIVYVVGAWITTNVVYYLLDGDSDGNEGIFVLAPFLWPILAVIAATAGVFYVSTWPAKYAIKRRRRAPV